MNPYWLDSLSNLTELYINDSKHVDLSALVNLKKFNFVLCNATLKILDTVNPDLIDLTIFNSLANFSFDQLLRQLRRFQKLESLHLEFFYINDFDINWLANHLNLKCLVLNECNIKRKIINRDSYISEKLMNNDCEQRMLPRLEKLSLFNSSLESINRDMLCELSCLKSLDLSYNKIKSLPDGVFADLVNLEELFLKGNHLSQVSQATFAGLVQLRTLDLSQNSLESLDPSTFEHLTNIEQVYLYHMKLTNRDIPSKSSTMI